MKKCGITGFVVFILKSIWCGRIHIFRDQVIFSSSNHIEPRFPVFSVTVWCVIWCLPRSYRDRRPNERVVLNKIRDSLCENDVWESTNSTQPAQCFVLHNVVKKSSSSSFCCSRFVPQQLSSSIFNKKKSKYSKAAWLAARFCLNWDVLLC